jgi:hypothetical protein
MSEPEFNLVHVPTTTANAPERKDRGKNHVLSRNPATTLCGIFRREGHPPAIEESDMCQKCLRLATKTGAGPNRPMRDNLKGIGR